MKVFLRLCHDGHQHYLAADCKGPFAVWAACMTLCKSVLDNGTKKQLEAKSLVIFSDELYYTLKSQPAFRTFHETAVNKIRSWMEDITSCNQKKSKQS